MRAAYHRHIGRCVDALRPRDIGADLRGVGGTARHKQNERNFRLSGPLFHRRLRRAGACRCSRLCNGHSNRRPLELLFERGGLSDLRREYEQRLRRHRRDDYGRSGSRRASHRVGRSRQPCVSRRHRGRRYHAGSRRAEDHRNRNLRYARSGPRRGRDDGPPQNAARRRNI